MMNRQPTSTVIYRVGNVIINCSEVATVVLTADQETGPWFVVVGKKNIAAPVIIPVEDREQGNVVAAHLHRGMVAALQGRFDLLDGFGLGSTPPGE